MIFVCKNCDGNTVYSPERKKMYCPYCEGEETHLRKDTVGPGDTTICPNCGGEVGAEEFDATKQCPYCDSYLIFDKQIEGDYKPKFLVPFQMGRESCKQAIRRKFKKHTFAPTDFLSDAKLNGMKGVYVPFWFYDYRTKCHFEGEGTITKVWTTVDKRYTETSYYHVERDLDIDFEKMPADASLKMPDDIMDLMAPYDYGKLEAFKPEYLSGFYAERYNMPAEELEGRVHQKMEENAGALIKGSYDGYHKVTPARQQVVLTGQECSYGMLPVWKYDYTYRGVEYPFYVNGQTGKIVGTVPLSKAKLWTYSATVWMLAIVCIASVFGIILLV